MQESVGVERLPIKLFSKLIPMMEYHICTSFGASLEFYRGLNESQGRTGQGHILSINICRDSTYFIFMAI